jgi:anti-anti-sigma regulatory factor
VQVFLSEYRGAAGQTAVEVSLNGVAGLSDAGPLRRVLRHLLHDNPKTVLVNLRRLRDMDRACWNHLVSMAREVRRKGGRVVLRNCAEPHRAQIAAQHWEGVFEVPECAVGDAADTGAPGEPRA